MPCPEHRALQTKSETPLERKSFPPASSRFFLYIYICIHVLKQKMCVPACLRACSIYRCEALEEIVSHTREGKEEPDEFVRIDVSGKAFVYVRRRRRQGFPVPIEMHYDIRMGTDRRFCLRETRQEGFAFLLTWPYSFVWTRDG